MDTSNARVANLLHDRQCPYDYKCLATDCIECIKQYMEKGDNEKDVHSDT